MSHYDDVSLCICLAALFTALAIVAIIDASVIGAAAAGLGTGVFGAKAVLDLQRLERATDRRLHDTIEQLIAQSRAQQRALFTDEEIREMSRNALKRQTTDLSWEAISKMTPAEYNARRAEIEAFITSERGRQALDRLHADIEASNTGPLGESEAEHE